MVLPGGCGQGALGEEGGVLSEAPALALLSTAPGREAEESHVPPRGGGWGGGVCVSPPPAAPGAGAQCRESEPEGRKGRRVCRGLGVTQGVPATGEGALQPWIVPHHPQLHPLEAAGLPAH